MVVASLGQVVGYAGGRFGHAGGFSSSILQQQQQQEPVWQQWLARAGSDMGLVSLLHVWNALNLVGMATERWGQESVFMRGTHRERGQGEEMNATANDRKEKITKASVSAAAAQQYSDLSGTAALRLRLEKHPTKQQER